MYCKVHRPESCAASTISPGSPIGRGNRFKTCSVWVRVPLRALVKSAIVLDSMVSTMLQYEISSLSSSMDRASAS